MKGRFVALCILLGCGGPPSGADTVHLETRVHLVRGDQRERLGVSPDQARIRASAEALDKSLGHPVVVEIDAAVTPETTSALVAMTANSLEALARRFSEEERRDPVLHAFVRRSLQRIEVRYEATAEYMTADFDDARGALVYEMRAPTSPDGTWLPMRYETDDALTRALQRDLAKSFPAGAVSSSTDDEARLRFLRIQRVEDRKSEPANVRAERLVELLRFEEESRGRPIHPAVEKSLAEQLEWVLTLDPGSASERTLAGPYARWIGARFESMTPELQRRFAERLLENRRTREAACPSDPCPRLPDLDRTALALRLLDPPRDPGSDAARLDHATCPYVEKDGRLERTSSCWGVFEFLSETPARAERLVKVLVDARQGGPAADAARARSLLISALVTSRQHLPTLLDALDRKGGALYADALTILVDHRARDASGVLDDAVSRQWSKREDLRPLLLRIVAERTVASQRDDAYVATLANEYAPLDALLFARFLDLGPRSVELAPSLWPALRDVRTPFEILAPRLDRYVNGRGIEAAKVVSALVRRACATKDLEGLRVMRAVLERRVKAGDKDAVALALSARDCKALKPTEE